MLALAAFLTLGLGSRDAHAFTWMVRHGYTQCTPCHVDPSGSGLLAPYGRAVADEFVRMRFPGEAEPGGETARSAGFLWGVLPMSETIMLQGDIRYLHLEQKVPQVPVISRGIWMQADFSAAARIGNFTALGSLGYADEGALAASLTRAPSKNLVSRQHWLGYSLQDGAVMLRGGRMNLPFGLRVYEHTLWVRARTRSNINDQQQYGLSAIYQGDKLRAELMAVLGNFELRPDNFRERGYSGYVEGYLSPKWTVGASSLITYRALDPITNKQTFRQAHGIFGRYATPWEPLVLLSEWDYALESPRYAKRTQGLVGFLQADLELTQGLHLIATGEASNVGLDTPPVSLGAWLSTAWFFAPHADLRVDSIYQRLGSTQGATDSLTLLIQGHVFF